MAAGRTVENDIEHAAFAVLSDQALIWKKLNDLGKCRYRCATVTDMTGDGHPELVLGGRIDQEITKYALLDIWKAHNKDMNLISRYRFAGSGSTRLRVVEPLPGFPGRLIIGRADLSEWAHEVERISPASGIRIWHLVPLLKTDHPG